MCSGKTFIGNCICFDIISANLLIDLKKLMGFVLILAATSVVAQEEEQQSQIKNYGRGIEEVIVTARRTEESAQDVPIAVSAMSADDLRREQINSPTDLNGRVPSLIVTTGNQMRNTETPSMRGQGAQFGAAPGVVMYISEVALPSDPIANYQGGPGKFFDLANIQILKGSQGTLFGRNTTGGAVLLEPAKPSEDFSVSVRAGYSRMARESGIEPEGHSYEAVVNLPIVDDTLMARIGTQVYKREGFTKDVVTGKDYDSKGYWIARLGLLWQPNEQVENYFMANYADSDDNGSSMVIKRINREGLNKAIPSAIGAGVITNLIPGVDLSQSANAGCLVLNYYGPSSNCGQDILDEQTARGNRLVQLSGDPNDLLTTGLYINKLSVELSDTLTLVNIASFSNLEHSYRWELDGSRAALNEFINPDDLKSTDMHTYTEELQLQGTAFDNALKFVLGAYYETTEAKGDVVATSLLFVSVANGYEQSKSSIAPFVQGTYDLGSLFHMLEGLSLTTGARYTKDKTTGSAYIRQIAADIYPLADKSFKTEVKSSALTYTAGLDYKFGDNMVYSKISKGYKTGGIATISANPDHYTYDPEFVLNYEIGQKSDFVVADIPVRLNSAVYYTDYSDMQVSAPDAYLDPNSPSPVAQLGQATFNVGQAWVTGFELDLTMQLFDGLTFIGTYGYTKAEYEEFGFSYFGATPQRDCSGNDISSGGEMELSCVPFKTVPEHQFSLSVHYLLPVSPQLGGIETSITYVWVDAQYSAQTSVPDVEPGSWMPSFGLTNASVSWRNILGSEFGMRVYSTNLTNEKYRVSNSNQWNLTYFQSSMYSEPRNVGLEVSYDFTR